MLAEAAGPDQRAARKMRPGHCTKKIHPGSPEVTFLGTDTSFAQSHPTLLKEYLIESNSTPIPLDPSHNMTAVILSTFRLSDPLLCEPGMCSNLVWSPHLLRSFTSVKCRCRLKDSLRLLTPSTTGSLRREICLFPSASVSGFSPIAYKI